MKPPYLLMTAAAANAETQSAQPLLIPSQIGYRVLAQIQPLAALEQLARAERQVGAQQRESQEEAPQGLQQKGFQQEGFQQQAL